ncbi:MAG: hypothetical protein JKY70_11155 [Mucilaginibacter sp.]|nr:hypothetical protein [Mucilaginibacter sp.]
MNGDVIIRKQKITVKTGNEQVAFECRKFLNDIVDNDLPKLYERVFYQNISFDTHINVKSLRVDLGTITLNDLKDQFIKITENEIIKELRHQFENNESDISGVDAYPFQNLSVEYTTQKEQNTKALLFFLEHGHYPWWYVKDERKSPISLLNDLNDNGQSEFLYDFFKRCREVDTAKMTLLVKRFVNQLNNFICENYIKQIVALYNDSSLNTNIAMLLSEIKQFTKVFDISSKAFYEELFCSVFTFGQRADFLKLFVNRLHTSFPVANHDVLNDFVRSDQRLSFLEISPHQIFKKDKTDNHKHITPVKHEIYIDNAGLIILHPFLPAYFNSLGLTDENDQFKSFESQVKASVLLYYLQCNCVSYQEWEMSLNKILCGLALSDVISSGVEITHDDIAESKELLNTVAGHWSALKGASAESMQNTFFQRAGKITHKEDAWLIQVERTAVDVLLDKLPWGFSTIKLPWLTQLIHTEW